MDFPIRPDLTPKMAQTALQMAAIDPMAAMRYISLPGEWDGIEEYSRGLVAALPPPLQNKAGAQTALTEALNLALADVLAPAAALPRVAPAAAVAAQPGPAPAPVAAPRKMSAAQYLAGGVRKAKQSAAAFLGLGSLLLAVSLPGPLLAQNELPAIIEDKGTADNFDYLYEQILKLRANTTSPGDFLGPLTDFSGDVTGKYNSMTVGNDSHTHGDATLTALSASKLTGALPALDGSALTGVVHTTATLEAILAAIQVELSTMTTELNGKVAKAGDTMSGDLHVDISGAVTGTHTNLNVYNRRTGGDNYGAFVGAIGVGGTSNIGLKVEAQGAASNKAVVIEYPDAGANNFSIYSPSSAQSHFAGPVTSLSSMTASAYYGNGATLAGVLTGPATFYIVKPTDYLSNPATFYIVKPTDYLSAPATFYVATAADLSAKVAKAGDAMTGALGITYTPATGLNPAYALKSNISDGNSIGSYGVWGEASNGLINVGVSGKASASNNVKVYGVIGSAPSVAANQEAIGVYGSVSGIAASQKFFAGYFDGPVMGTSSITANNGFYGDGSNLTGVIQSTATGIYPLSITGNSATSTTAATASLAYSAVALSNEPAGCAASKYVTDISSMGVLTCTDLPVTPAPGDNLGSHVATMTVTANYGISASTLVVTGSSFSVGGSTLVVSGGSVGIGTTAPETFLNVVNGSAGTVAPVNGTIASFESNGNTYLSLLSPSANARAIFFGSPASNTTAGITYNYALANGMTLMTTGNNRISIDNNGKVGVGVDTPQNRLDVEGGAVIGATYSGANTAPTNGLLVEGSVGLGNTAPLAKLDVTGDMNLSGPFTLTSSATINNDLLVTNTTPVSAKIKINGYYADPNYYTELEQGYGSGIFKLYHHSYGHTDSTLILADGGITSPGSATFASSVTVTGVVTSGAEVYAGAIFKARAKNSNPASSSAQSYGLNMGHDQTAGMSWIQSMDASAVALQLNPLGGNVGIGTTAPGAKLHVSGGTIRVEGTGAPTTGGALCLNASGNMSKCTSAIDSSGNCTCP